jgi:hypothetical protein
MDEGEKSRRWCLPLLYFNPVTLNSNNCPFCVVVAAISTPPQNCTTLLNHKIRKNRMNNKKPSREKGCLVSVFDCHR